MKKNKVGRPRKVKNKMIDLKIKNLDGLINNTMLIGSAVGLTAGQGLSSIDIGRKFTENGDEYSLINILDIATSYSGTPHTKPFKSFLFYRKSPFGLMLIPGHELYKIRLEPK